MYDVEFQLKSSRTLSLFFCALLCMAVLILMSLGWHICYKILAIIATSIYGFSILKRYVWLKSSSSITAIRKTVDDRWLVTTQKGCFFAEILSDSTVTQLITVLLFRIEGHRFITSCVLMRDSFHVADDYRKLIVSLKLYAMTMPFASTRGNGTVI